VVRHDLLEQLSQGRDVPLPVTQSGKIGGPSALPAPK
jgi:hypothetical protein